MLSPTSRLLLCFTVAFGGCAATLPPNYADAVRRSEVQISDPAMRSWATSLLAPFFEAHFESVLLACANSGSGRGDLVLALDSNGKVIRTYRSSSTALGACFEREWMALKWPIPPSAPFYARIDVGMTPNGRIEANADAIVNQAPSN